jgi:methionyl-tRNA formyltransferase
MVRTVELIARGGAARFEQDESLATLAPKLKPDDGRIRWDHTTQVICNLVRGVTPKPGAFTMFRGARLEIARIEPLAEYRIQNAECGIGRVIGSEKGKGPVVRTGDGAVALLELKPEGKKLIPGTAFVNGYRPEVGEMLG